jgi:mRNA-degrading endonuclease RelE of RelBE toxin-antitoxin system
MNVNIIVSDNFVREVKKLLKKYHSLKSELQDFQKSLEANPVQGTLITEGVYKIRLAVKSKGKGKSGGLRIITYIHIITNDMGETNVFLLSIYDKSEYESLPEHLIKNMVSEIQADLNTSQPEEGETAETDEDTPSE